MLPDQHTERLWYDDKVQPACVSGMGSYTSHTGVGAARHLPLIQTNQRLVGRDGLGTSLPDWIGLELVTPLNGVTCPSLRSKEETK